MSIENRLTNGIVTQNGTYISYKTHMYTVSHNCIVHWYNELCEFLKSNNIPFKETDFNIHKGDNKFRNHCVTIAVESETDLLPFESDAIN